MWNKFSLQEDKHTTEFIEQFRRNMKERMYMTKSDRFKKISKYEPKKIGKTSETMERLYFFISVEGLVRTNTVKTGNDEYDILGVKKAHMSPKHLLCS
jgi:hypothetical protein